MKEATGELNLTVITIVAIAAIAGLFYIFVWPSISNSIRLGTACSDPYGYSSNAPKDAIKGDAIVCTQDTAGDWTCTIGNTSRKCNNLK